MRLGSAERAGSGVDKIVGGWKFLELPAPTVEEEIRPDYVVLTMYLKTQDTPQDTNKIIRKEQNKKRLLKFCEEPRSLTEMMRFLELKDRKNFIDGYINPLLSEGVLTMTTPDKPTSGKQRYVKIPTTS